MSERAPIDFYFDFISPFGYFGSLAIDAVAARHGRATEWHAMLLGVSVLKVMGLKPLLDTPLKGGYIRNEVRRYARRHGIALGRAPDAPVMDPLPCARAFHWVKRHYPGREKELAHALYAAYWCEGRDLGSPAATGEVAAAAGFDAREITEAVKSPEASALLRAAVEASLARGVFGSPFVIVDSEPFWGVETFRLLEDWLASGGW
jgi:2-hydroxychromene-2-carboxylate isomerase